MFKKLLFSLILFAGIHFTTLAQGKTEIAVITFQPGYRELFVQTNGTEMKKIDVPKDQVKGNADFTAALKEVARMTEEGWEIKDTNMVVTGSAILTFFCTLTRKKS